MFRRHRWMTYTCCVTVAVGALAACGGDDAGDAGATEQTSSASSAEPSSGSTTASDGETTSAASDPGSDAAVEEIVIASVGNYSGVTSEFAAPGMEGVDAWVRTVNANGGVGGHPIKLIIEDDRADATRARTLIQDLVENQHVVAFVGNFASITQAAAGDYLAEKRVPVIGGEHGNPIWWENPMWFPFSADTNGQAFGYVEAAQRFVPDATNLGVLVCQESPACEVLGGQVKDWAEQAGMNVTYEGAASVAAVDYTAECIAAKDADIDILFVALSVTNDENIARDCARQGLEPTFMIASGDTNFEGKPEFEGAVTATPAFPAQYEGPETADFHAAMEEYHPGNRFSPLAANGWAIGVGFGKIVEAIDGPVTSEAILDQLWSFDGETLGGLVAPLHFVRDQPAPKAKCTWPIVYVDQTMTAPDGLEAVCAP